MRRSESYNCKGALVVGLLMVIIGVVLFFAQIPKFIGAFGASNVGSGFWVGLYFILLGSLEIGSSRNRDRRMIIAVMVLSILGYFVAVGGGIAVYMFFQIGAPSGSYSNEDNDYKVHAGITYTQMALCIAESFLCIAAAVLCCKGVCGCCGATSQVSNEGDAEDQSQPITSKH